MPILSLKERANNLGYKDKKSEEEPARQPITSLKSRVNSITSESEQAQTNHNIVKSSGLKPDEVADSYNKAKRLGIPFNIVNNAKEEVTRLIETPSFKIPDPRLIQSYLGKNVINAAISNDDIENLENVQTTWEKTKAGYETHDVETRINLLIASRDLLGGDPDKINKQIERLEQQRELIAPYEPEGFFEKTVVFTAEQIPQQWMGIKRGLERAPLGAFVGATVAGLAGLFLEPSPAEEAITLPLIATTAKGAVHGFFFGRMESLAYQEYGGAVREFSQITDKQGNKIDPKIAKYMAVGVGLVNAALENLAFKKLLQTFPGGKKLIDKLDSKLIKSVVKSPTIMSKLKDIAKDAGEAMLTEETTEVLQELSNVIFGEMAKKLESETTDAEFEDFDWVAFKERMTEIVNTTFYSTVGFVLPGTTISTTKAVMDSVASNKFNNDINNMKDAVDKTNTQQRSTDHSNEFLKTIGVEQPAFISPEGIDMLYQDNLTEEADAILKKVGITPQEAKTKAASGQDIEISQARLLSKLSREDYNKIAQDIKPAPSAYTQRELNNQLHEEDVENSVKLFQEQIEQDRQINEEIQRIAKEGKKAGLTEDEAKNAPILIRGLANRLSLEGINPIEFLKKIGIKKTAFEKIGYVFQRGKELFQKEKYIKDNMIKKIKNIIVDRIESDTLYEHDIYGIRAIKSDISVKERDILPESFKWIDGERTKEILAGTSAIHIVRYDDNIDMKKLDNDINNAMNLISQYQGNQLILIGGDFAGWGEDRSEVIISNAQVIKTLETKFLQAEKGKPPRAAIPITNESHLIALFEGADLSSVLHEVGHIALKEYVNLEQTGQASESLKADLITIRKWVNAKEGQELTREQSEQFARGFEAYLMEGKAPTIELQSAFERFKNWLLSVYKHGVKELNIKLNKDVKQVFDRMLSANLEVEAMAQSGGFTIKTKEEMSALGMNEADQRYIKELIDRTVKKAERRLNQDRNKNYRENINTWRKQSRREIKNENPIYRTIDDIISNNRQINRSEFIERYGEELIKLLPTSKILKIDGESMDMVAGFYGFNDYLDMFEQFFTTPKLSEAVNQRVNEKRAQFDAQYQVEDYIVDSPEYREYLDIIARNINDRAAKTEIIEQSIENNKVRWRKEATNEIQETSPELTGQELNDAIEERLNEKIENYRRTTKKAVKITRERLKILARQTIDSKSVKEAQRVDYYLSAMKKAANDERRAILRKDWAAASRANELARFNYELAGLAVKARNEINTILKRAKRLGKSKSIDNEHREAILHLVARYNMASLIPQDPKAIPDFKKLFGGEMLDRSEKIIEDEFPVPDFLFANLTNDYRDLSMEQFRDLDNAIRYLEGKGKLKNKEFMTDGVTKLEDIITKSVESIRRIKKPLKVWEKNSMMRKLSDKTRNVFAMFDSLTFTTKSLDGYVNIQKGGQAGIIEQWLSEKIKDGMDKRTAKAREIETMLKPHLTQISKTIRKWTKKFGNHIRIEGVPLPELMRLDGQTKGWYPYQIFAIALNVGNKGERSNYENLLAGYPGLNAGQIDKILDMLSQEDMDAVQGIWDVIESLFKDTNEQYLRTNNYNMSRIEATPFRFKDKQYRGGYYPISHDRALSYKVADRGQVEDLFNNEAAPVKVPYTKRGHTIKRLGGVALPILLDLNVLDEHFRDSLNYIYLTDAVRDSDRIVRNHEFRREASKFLGEAVYKTLRPALQHIANPKRAGLDIPGSRAINWARGLSTAYTLAWNTGVAIKQPLSTFSAIHKMGFKAYINGFSSVLMSPSMHYQQMIELSNYMKDRRNSFDRELKSAFLNLTKQQRGIYFDDTKVTWQDVKNFGFWQIRLADTLTVIPIWHGAFKSKLNADQSNLNEAIRYADNIVRDTQPSAQPLDLSTWQRDGGFMRLFSQFQTFTVGKYQQRQRLFFRAWRNNSISTLEYAWFNFMDAILPLLAINFVQSIIWGRDIEDEETQLDILYEVVTGWLFMGVPFARNLFRTLTGYGEPLDSPILRTANKAINGITTGAKNLAEFDDEEARIKALWGLAHTVSILSGVPVSQIVSRAERGAEAEDAAPLIKYLIPPPRGKD